jgi:glycosyltransferase involved in cell wall biosynthesis
MTHTAPLFSIATPTRNALDKLRRCVGSVRGQAGVSFEHLVQDAQSSDGSAPWLAAQAQVHPSLQHASEADGGMYDAINRAWGRANGQYLSWLNADEQYLPGTLARVQQFFEAHPQVDALFADYLVADEQGRAVALRREIGLRKFYVVNTFLNAQSCTLFYRRKLWDEGVLKLDSRFRYAADQDLVLRLLARGVRFHHLPEVLSVFGVDGSNLSTHPQMEEEAEAVRLAFGGFRWRPLRALAYAGRRAERLLGGSYRNVNLRYRFALNETPDYADYLTQDLGGRYSLADTVGRGQRTEALSATPVTPGSNGPSTGDKQP